MLKVTDNAKQLLGDYLREKTDDTETGLKLVQSFGEIKMVLGKVGDDDQVIEHGGTKILIVTPEVNLLFESATLDVKDSGDGVVFFLSKNKNLGEN